MMARRCPVDREAALRFLIVFSWLVKSPWEKLSRAIFIPARIICSMTSSDSDAGPIVQTILVLWLAKPSLSLRLFIIHEDDLPGSRSSVRRRSIRLVMALPHLLRLPRYGEDAIPNPSLRIHLLALRGSHGDGHMGEFIDPETDHHVGPSCHTGMNGVLS